MFAGIRAWEWNDWFHALCWAGLIVTFVMLPWYWTPVLWVFEWAVWMTWVAWMEHSHPEAIRAFFKQQEQRHFSQKQK